MDINKIYDDLKVLMNSGNCAIVYPIDKTEESARKIANEVDAALGVVEFIDDNNNYAWGVLLDKTKINNKDENKK